MEYNLYLAVIARSPRIHPWVSHMISDLGNLYIRFPASTRNEHKWRYDRRRKQAAIPSRRLIVSSFRLPVPISVPFPVP